MACKLEHELPAGSPAAWPSKLEHQLPTKSPAARPSNWNISSTPGLQVHSPQTATSAPSQVSSCMALKLQHQFHPGSPASQPSNWNISSPPRSPAPRPSTCDISSQPGLQMHGPQTETSAPHRVSSWMALNCNISSQALKQEHQLPTGSPAARPSNCNISSPPGLQLHGPQTGTSAARRVIELHGPQIQT
nr:mucin-1-like [Pongo pygmaeus]